MAENDLIGYEFEVQGLREAIDKLSGYDEFSTRRLTQAMQQSVTLLESSIKPLTPVFRGRLRGSIGSEVRGVGSDIEGRVGSTLKDEEYPAVMEFGRRPGTMPPIDPLVRWVRLKRLSGVYNAKTKRRMGGRATQDQQDRATAFVIARSIARKGIVGKRFMQRGYETSQVRIARYFSDAVTALTQDLANGHS